MNRLPAFVASAFALLVASPAWAITCDEIMQMVDVNVPVNIVVQTMESSGTKFTTEQIKCLTTKGAPDAVLEAAKRMAAGDVAEVTAPTGNKPPVSPVESEPAHDTFEGTETLGSEVPQGEDTAPAGADEADSAGGPSQIEDLIKLYKAKKLLTASKGFYDLLEDKTFPEEESKLNYYLAKSLFDLQMYHSAQHYFMEVVRKGPRNPYFKYALPKLVQIAELTGDDSELLRIVDKIPPESFPRAGKNRLYYLMGRKLYEDEKLSEALKYFQQISSKSDLYLKGKYYEGVINNERGKLKTAVKSFRDVYQSPVETQAADARSMQEMNDLRDLSLMNIARIYYGIDRYDTADNFYSLVDRNSTYWPESLYERAWTDFMRNQLNDTLGLLLTVRSPYYSDEEFIPEATILRALTFFQLCHHKEVERILTGFEADYAPMRDEMKAFLDQYNTEDGRRVADQAYDAYFVNPHKDSHLSKALFLRVLRNKELADLVHHLQMLDDEEATIDAQKGAWKDSIGARLEEVIQDDRARYKRKAGLVLIKEMSTQYDVLNDLNTQSEIIRFEVVDAERADYEYKMQNVEVATQGDSGTDFATSKDEIYWPFNGEFWSDELGYYQYTEKPECNYKQ